MPEIGSRLLVNLLSGICCGESLNIFKVNLKTFTVICHLMYQTVLSLYAFILRAFSALCNGTFVNLTVHIGPF